MALHNNAIEIIKCSTKKVNQRMYDRMIGLLHNTGILLIHCRVFNKRVNWRMYVHKSLIQLNSVNKMFQKKSESENARLYDARATT